jgi:hypothetical protein
VSLSEHWNPGCGGCDLKALAGLTLPGLDSISAAMVRLMIGAD